MKIGLVVKMIGKMSIGAALLRKYASEEKEMSNSARLIIKSFVDTFDNLAANTVDKLKGLTTEQVILKK